MPSIKSILTSIILVQVLAVGLACAGQDEPTLNVTSQAIPVQPGHHPFAALIERSIDGGLTWFKWCTGSIVGNKHILTAAFCLKEGLNNLQLSQLRVKTGCNLISDCGNVHNVTKIVPHGSYIPHATPFAPPSNDIGLIEVRHDIKFDGSAGPTSKISLITEKIPDSLLRKLKLVGWGAGRNGETSNMLLEIREMIGSPPEACRPIEVEFGPNELCASNGGRDKCRGFVGGPLMKHTDSGPILIGVAPGNRPCGFAGIFTRISSFHPWITSCSTGGLCNPF